jgi:hypothetical protein
MKRRIVISEDEKQTIKNLYKINEQDDLYNTFVQGINQSWKELMANKSKGINTSSPSSTSDKPISEKGQELLNNPVFKEKLKEISQAINIDEKDILKLMYHESRYDPNATNPDGCVGLIQFCSDPTTKGVKTINGVRYNLNDLKNDLVQQMDAIKEFWLSGYKSGKIKSPEDLYTFNLFPVAAGKPDDFVLQTDNTSAQKIAKSNPIFNRKLGRPDDTPLTVGDLNRYYKQEGMV